MLQDKNTLYSSRTQESRNPRYLIGVLARRDKGLTSLIPIGNLSKIGRLTRCMPTGSPKDGEADHLLGIVRLQMITRRRAREATRDKSPWNEATRDLKQLVAAA